MKEVMRHAVAFAVAMFWVIVGIVGLAICIAFIVKLLLGGYR